MILSDAELRKAIERQALIITPGPTAADIKTSAIDLHLADEFRRWKQPTPGASVVIDPWAAEFQEYAAAYTEVVPHEADGSVVLQPKGFLLAKTREKVELPEAHSLAARVEGRSGLARLGLGVHLTAPTIHAGFRGQIALEMVNHGVYPIRLRPGSVICQIIVESVYGTPAQNMTGVFQNQTSTLGSSREPS